MRVWVALLAASFLVAGCAEDAAPPQSTEPEFVLEEELVVTDTTGIIRGVVVDNAVVPIESANVSVLNQEMVAKTNAQGAFGFADLEEGTYFLEVKATGMIPVQQSVEVVAGQNQPPIIRVMLQPDPSFVSPYHEMFQHAGFYQCGTSVVVLCAAPNIFFGQGTTDDSSTPTFYWEKTPDFIQTEMRWDSTQTVSTELYYEMEALDGACSGKSFLTNAEGDSPIRTRVDRVNLDEATIGGDCGIYYSVFSGGLVGFSIEQPFDWYITSFYGYQPLDDWWFIHDGPYWPPQ